MAPASLLPTLQQQLDDLRAGRLRPAEFSTVMRSQADLLNRLPPRYAEVLHDLLDRLESSALFAEESCSFSQSGLLDNLQLWLDKVELQLGKV